DCGRERPRVVRDARRVPRGRCGRRHRARAPAARGDARRRGRPAGVRAAARVIVSPELFVRRSREAVDFYVAAFGADELYRFGHDEIVAELSVGESTFWVVGESPDLGHFSPESQGGTTVRLLLIVDDPHTVVERALGLGAKEIAGVHEEHGWLLGRIEDPYGHYWEIGRKLS